MSINNVSFTESTRLFYVPLQFSSAKTTDALIDTGAFASALPLAVFQTLKASEPSSVTVLPHSLVQTVTVANGKSVQVLF